jgi:hypothetical protein
MRGCTCLGCQHLRESNFYAISHTSSSQSGTGRCSRVQPTSRYLLPLSAPPLFVSIWEILAFILRNSHGEPAPNQSTGQEEADVSPQSCQEGDVRLRAGDTRSGHRYLGAQSPQADRSRIRGERPQSKTTKAPMTIVLSMMDCV